MSVTDSILDTMKINLLGNTEDTDFDTELIMHINTVFSYLYQIGVGPKEGFKITGSEESWSSYLEDEVCLDMVKSYMYLKIKVMFDSPTGGVLTSYENQIKELEWRMSIFSSSEVSELIN